jgi:cyclic-di-AMP phosphodiesterase PgpH
MRNQMPEKAAKRFRDFVGMVKRSDFKTSTAFLHSPAFSWILLVTLSATVAILTSVSLQYIPTTLEEGMIAARNIKADRNYEIVDEEATKKFQDEAAAGVLPVYDYDPRIVDAEVGRIESAFDLARKMDESIMKETRRPRRARLTDEDQSKIKKGFEAVLGKEPNAAVWKSLVLERFSKQMESYLVWIYRDAMVGPLVKDQKELKKEMAKGIVLRRLKVVEGGEGEEEYDESIVKSIKGIGSEENAKRIIENADIPRRGLRSKESVPSIKKLAKLLVQPNCDFNRIEELSRSESAAADVKNVVLKVKSGEMIIREGARYEPWHIKVLSGIQKDKGKGNTLLQFSGTFILVLLFLMLPFYMAERYFRSVRPTRSDHFLMAIVGFSILIIVRLSFVIAPAIHESLYFGISTSALSYLIPVAGGAMLIRMYLGAEISVVFAVVISVITGLFLETDVQFVVYCIASSFAAIVSVARVDRRSLIIRAGLITGAVGLVAVVGTKLIEMASGGGSIAISDLLWSAFFALLGGMGSAIYTMIGASIVESASGYTSDIKLLELANLNHPLLRELIVRAPGTYHHSHLVGILGEAAAEAIGANPLLVRVGAYYHDIGKIKKPQYFIENVRGSENRHDKLSPSMSALIVAAHAKDGQEMASKAGVPKVITDMIPQHHGTRLIKFFYEKAKEQEDPELQKIDAKDFKYPGPKPQNREAAILMLADVTEAAVRSLKEKSSTRIKQTVKRGINDVFAESQLDECELTLRDLHEISSAFVRILLGIYHQRIEYPKDKEDEKPEVNVAEERSSDEDTDDEPTTKEEDSSKGN